MEFVGQRAEKLPSINFENESNLGRVESGPNMLVHPSGVMAEVVVFWGDLQHLVTLQPFVLRILY